MRLGLCLSVLPALLLGLLDTATALTRLDQQEASPEVIAGVVVDATGAPLPGALVTLRHQGSSARTITTDPAGRFAFSRVQPGPATISVSIEQFAPVTIEVKPSPIDLRVVLQPLAVTEQVTVTAPRRREMAVASSTKTGTPLRNVPQAVTLVSKEAIADQSMQSMADVVRYVPGIGMAQGEGNRDTPIFRGNTSTSDFYIDGVRDDVQYFRDLYNVERIEALKGPNALIFGRGGGGGVINRVTRQAEWTTVGQIAFEGGSYDHRRLTADVGRGVSQRSAFRLTSMYEDSGSYRAGVDRERYGVNPTVAFAIGKQTTLRAGYEHFHDDRTADRGIPSFARRPVATNASTFFGNPSSSWSRATVDSVTSSLDHEFNSRWNLRNRISFATYDKFYQNVYPSSAVEAAGMSVNISAYNNATARNNLFNQTDLIGRLRTGFIAHTVLAGAEVGRQLTDHFRNTGYFSSVGPTTTAVAVTVENPLTALPIAFRQSASDVDNHSVATVAAAYAQDQVELSRQVEAIVGVRYDQFDVELRNNRTGTSLTSKDRLVSPRIALVYKPIEPVSVYGSYTLAYLPRAGEQLSSLSVTNHALDPEKFRNYEVGAKWQLRPLLTLSAAAYRLDRGNVVVPDPLDPTRSLLVDGQQTHGLEIDLGGSVTRAWSLLGAYAYQDGEITRTQSATVRAGASLAQLPRHTLSLWNKYNVTSRWGLGVGVIRRGDVFASTDNTVTLPGFTRVDGAVFFAVNTRLRGQANFENLLDARYYPFSNGNNNITPGSPRSFRVSLTMMF